MKLSSRRHSLVASTLAFIVWMTLGCQTKRVSPPEGASALPPIESSSSAPAELKLADFRLNPPIVEDMAVRKGPRGQLLLEVQYALDSRFTDRITLTPDETPVVLHDDGRDGDRQTGDRIFTAVVPGNFDELATRQRQLVQDLSKRRGGQRMFSFRGREVIAADRLDERLIAEMVRPDRIRLIQIGGSTVDEKRSLVITDPAVVEDPSRTFNPCTGVGTPGGKWTFAYLMRQMANTPKTGINPSDFVQRWLQRWLNAQTVNGFTVPARSAQMQALLSRWPKLADGRLDLDRAPVKLLAIVNRIDLGTNVAYGGGNAGEGRFVFDVINTANGGCSAMPFTIIFEYGVPKHRCTQIRAWANEWLNLGTLPLGSASYNAALEAITEQFAKADAAPSKPNGSAINQLRTNEIALGSPWELREFRIFSTDSDAGQLREVTVKQTPDRGSFGPGGPNQSKLASWINTNTAAILLDAHSVPADLPFPDLIPFLGGASPNSVNFWDAPGIGSNDARFHFSLNTCDACHGRETNTGFTHFTTVGFGQEAQLSGFMKGDGAGGPFIVNDPVVAGTTHSFFDLQRRAQVLFDFANQPCFFLVRFRPILMSD